MRILYLISIFCFIISGICNSMDRREEEFTSSRRQLPYIDETDGNIASAWDIYDSAKRIVNKNKRVERLLEAFNADNASDECKGWAAHDIGDIYASTKYREAAVEYYKYAIKFGDEKCENITKNDIKNYRLLKYFPEYQ